MAGVRPKGYSMMQIMLHWSVATLVVFQFFINDEIGEAWRGIVLGEPVDDEAVQLASVHVIMGVLILVLTLWRIVLRVFRGAPPPPEGEPRVLRILAEATHGLLYLLLIVTPLSGAAAWFLESEAAAAVHGVARVLLFFVAVIHIAGALVQVFVFRSDVLSRMLMTKD